MPQDPYQTTIHLVEAMELALNQMKEAREADKQARRLWEKLPALLKYMKTTGAEMHIFSDGSGQIIPAGGGEPVWSFYAPQALADAPVETFPRPTKGGNGGRTSQSLAARYAQQGLR